MFLSLKLPAIAKFRNHKGSVTSVDSAFTLLSSAESTKYSYQGSLDLENVQPDDSAARDEFPGWPQRPEKLEKIRHRLKHAIYDIIMAGVALLWLVYGAYVYTSDRKPVHEKETKLFEAGRIVSQLEYRHMRCQLMTRFRAQQSTHMSLLQFSVASYLH